MSVQCWSRKEFFLYQFGEAFPFLIKEKLAVKLAGIRFNNLVILKGIGINVVHCNLQILSTIQICQFNLEIMFNVVMDEHLKHDILIGPEILALGFGITMDADKFNMI